jgi:hypothetical protein
MENHDTYKILATPVTPDRSQYKYVYCWVTQDVPCMHAEICGRTGAKSARCTRAGCAK